MVTPAFLIPGDQVALVATARFIDTTDLEPALALLRSWQLKPVLAPNLSQQHHQFAGDDATRASVLQAFLDNPNIKAIWCVRGGYGSIRLLDQLNFKRFKTDPKWIIGYSDVTVFHNVAQSLGIQSVHGTMPIDLSKLPTALGNDPKALEAIRNLLFGTLPHQENLPAVGNRNGTATGQLTGGNLSMLYSMCGSAYQVETSGKILFLEDLDEYLYHIDRMLQNLKNNGLLQDLEGLIVGGFTKMHDNSISFGMSAKEIILNLVSDYNYPVAFDWPVGHIHNNYPLLLGRTARFEVTPRAVSLNYQ